ncbi:MAG TPA: S8 family peptidase [Casimicrobiaceae bacterium]|nr:S8 family peptidase [Casimicrobiaceae bacterium]
MRFTSPFLIAPLCALLLGFAPHFARSQSTGAPSVGPSARVIVKLKADSAVLKDKLASVTEERQRRAKALGGRLGVDLAAGRAITDRTQVVTADGIASADLARRLAREADVEYAVVDQRRQRLAAPNDPLYAAGVPGLGPAVGQWYLRAPSGEVQSPIDVETAWSYTTGTPGTIVAVVDTGVRFEHPDLGAVAAGGKLLPGYDMISVAVAANDGDNRDPDASDPGDWVTSAEANNKKSLFYGCTTFDASTNQYGAEDSSWHGTQVSGIVGALTNNGIGMAGVGPNLRVLPVRALGKCGGFDSDIIAGMRWAAGLDVPGVPGNIYVARVINLSLGGPGDCPSSYQDAIAEITNAGAVVVAAAGNTVGHAAGVPANCPGAIGVGGLRHAGTKVGFSDLGLSVAIAAPAGNCVNTGPGSACLYPILSTSNSGTTLPADSIYTDSYNVTLGTSFAAPLVAGTVGLMLSAQPSLTPYQVRILLQKTVRAFSTTGGDTSNGPVPACVVPRLDSSGNPIDQGECYCNVNTCGAGMLDAGAAVRAAATGVPSAAVQAGGLWWDILDGEDGTGFTITHQGEVIFLGWYTYDQSGRAWWLSMTATRTASNPETYAGQLFSATGPPFSSVPFDGTKVVRTPVGFATLTFSDLDNATYSYTVNGVSGAKTISRTVFGTLPSCTYGAAPDFLHATNYQDVWWVANGAEAGWGVMISQQGNTIFAGWFTYDTDGEPLWLSVTASNSGPGVYTGDLIRTTGPPFGGTYDASLVKRTTVGTATFTFANGLAGTFSYVLNGIQQTKQITRYLFSPPAGTLCQ